MEKKVRVKNPHNHLVSVDGILYYPGEEREVVLNDKVKYALEKGILVEVKPQAKAPAKQQPEQQPQQPKQQQPKQQQPKQQAKQQQQAK